MAIRASALNARCVRQPRLVVPCRPYSQPQAPSLRTHAREYRPSTVTRFTENSLLTDLMPLLSPTSSFLSPRQLAPFSRHIPLRSIVADVIERPDGYEIKCDLPGVPKEQIKIDHQNDVLNISVEQQSENQEEEEEEGVVWHRMERQSNFARRSMRLPEVADFDNIVAKYNDGVLTVKVPKKEQKVDVKRIEISD